MSNPKPTRLTTSATVAPKNSSGSARCSFVRTTVTATPTSPYSAVEVEDLTKHYGDVRALDGARDPVHRLRCFGVIV
jgi:hypothetical protein